jgi:DNA-binding protein H-NS
MAISLEGMSAQELQALIDAAKKQSVTAAKEHIHRVRDEITKLLNKEGLTLSEVFGNGNAGKGSRKAVAAKYANPANPTQTWSGRGKRPIWFKEALAKGTSEAKLLIGDAAPSKAAASKKVVAKKGAPAKAAKKAARKTSKK